MSKLQRSLGKLIILTVVTPIAPPAWLAVTGDCVTLNELGQGVVRDFGERFHCLNFFNYNFIFIFQLKDAVK